MNNNNNNNTTFLVSQLTNQTVAKLIEGIEKYDAAIRLNADGRVEIVFPDGSFAVIGDPALLANVPADSLGAFIQSLNETPELLFDFVSDPSNAAGQGDTEEQSAIYSRLDYDLSGSGDITGNATTSFAETLFSNDLTGHIFAVNLNEIYAPHLFSRVNAGVGNDLPHLPGLPNEEYPRDFDPLADVFDNDGFVGAEPPALSDDTFILNEDNPVSGNVLENDYLPNSNGPVSLGQPPANGTVVLNSD